MHIVCSITAAVRNSQVGGLCGTGIGGNTPGSVGCVEREGEREGE